MASTGRDAEAIERAIKTLWRRSTFALPDRRLTVAVLIRGADWRPLRASWWRGKEACIIGVDLAGNFFLRHCDGGVRYWDHATQTDTTIAPSVVTFCAALREPEADQP